ncbi:hypothetical protein, partial [Burkholderia vietnamiensis]|uniref:hypothetical protein n=1 Tax=Burkholderia vietnamiensis TaxID=60552 RepID=UPI0039BFD208
TCRPARSRRRCPSDSVAFHTKRHGAGKDRLYLSYGSYVEFVEKYPLLTKVSRATYFNCLNELIEKKILFKSTLTNIFFINIAYVFNGDRLRFITEYQLKKEKPLVDDLEDDEE